MLWLDGASSYDLDDVVTSGRDCVKFIARLITCKNDKSIPIVNLQNHRPTAMGCKKKGPEKCEGSTFHGRWWPKIVFYFPSLNKKNSIGNDFYLNQKANETIVQKTRRYFISGYSGRTRISTIRSELKKEQIYLEWGSSDVGMNA